MADEIQTIIIGRSRLDVFTIDNSMVKDAYVGDEAVRKACISSLKYPIERGIVKNWDDMEKLYNHIFENELHTGTKEHPILLTEAPFNPKANREKMIQLMFETFDFPSLCVAYQGRILSAFSAGINTGFICDVGEGVSIFTPIYEGYPIPHAIFKNNIGGQDIINYFQQILNYRGYSFTTSEEKEILRDVVEKHGLVSLHYNEDLRKS